MAKNNFTMYVDDTDIDFFGMKLISYEIPSYAKRKTVGTDIPGAHGTQQVPSPLESGTFLANIVCEGRTTEDVNTLIREFFASMHAVSGSHKIVFSDDAEVVRYAVLDTPGKHRVVNGVDNAFAEIQLTFFMLDPFVYSDTVSTVVASCIHGEDIMVYNEAFECPAVFSVRNIGLQTVNDIALIVNEELASFSCPLDPGDIVELDTAEYEVRKNGKINLDYWRGEMPLLKNGVNRICQQNSTQSILEVTITFTRRWA